MRFNPPILLPSFCAGALLFSGLVLRAADSRFTAPANLGGGLRELAAWHATNAQGLAPQRSAAVVQDHLRSSSQRVQSDAAGRVVVDVYLNGAAPEADVRAALEALGAHVLASLPGGRSTAAAHGVMSAYLPVEQAAAVAKLPGVQSVMLVHRPWRRVGAKTSQGLPPMKVLPVQRRKFKGAGITVGVVSDSYNVTAPTAGVDVTRDDLPGLGNRAKHTTPVNVIEEGAPDDSSNIDEGRAMLQIIHDVAPESALAFCAVGVTQATFADAIRRLRTEGNCDIIVDDIGFAEEPMFSDGIVAQAVEEVVNSAALAGRKVIYYSAAGNSGELGYESDFAPVSDADARNGMAGANNLKLSQVPAELSGGGFHNFTPAAAPNIAQRFVVSGDYVEINFQWNDLFDAAAMTSDFNLLVFDEDGNFLTTDGGGNSVSGVDDAFATGQALERLFLAPDFAGGDRVYQIAISRRAGGSGAAQHFRYVADSEGGIGGKFFNLKVPTMFGHSGARSGDGVAAYAYNKLARPEDFSSFGPVAIYFDDAGNRLGSPEVRLQPTIAGPDGVATSLAGFRPFFGTSAAAPHAAGAAALMLQAAGGPGSLTPAQVREAFQATAFPHDLDPLIATAESNTSNGVVTLVAEGDASNFSSASERFFTLTFAGPTGSQLKSVLIDLARAALKFDTDPTLGFPFTVGSLDGGATTPVASVLPGKRRLLLTFADFPPGGSIRFGIDRDLARTSAAGNSGDELAKALVTATILPAGATKVVTQKAAFASVIGTGYSPADGFGFINVDAALKRLGR